MTIAAENPASTSSQTKRIGHWIDGKIVLGTSGKTSPVWNPATGKEQARLDLASLEEMHAVIASSKKAATVKSCSNSVS
jgi:malonate-semialdehyde dehydrogenase (acetylating) / methylmalonate-semialdehyde dehydrogenase